MISARCICTTDFYVRKIHASHESLMKEMETISETLRTNSFHIDVERPLWRENGSVLYNCCWSSPTHSLCNAKSKLKLYYDRQSVGQSVLVSGNHLEPATNSHSLFDYFLDSFGFADAGSPLWLEVGSVLFSFSRASPAQPFSDLSPTGLMSTVYCLYFWDSLNLEGQVPVFISPRNKVAQLYPRALG
jgi:hypothetical protein